MRVTGNRTRLLALGLITSLALAGTVLTAPGAAAAACDPEVVHSYGDLDGDSISDVVVGMPSWEDGTGAVDVRGSRTPDQQLTSDLLGGTRGDNDQVGAAVVIGDLDGDGCSDLVIDPRHVVLPRQAARCTGASLRFTLRTRDVWWV